VAAAEAAHFADFIRLEMLRQLGFHGVLCTGEQTGAAVAHIRFFALVFGPGEVVKRSRAIHVGIAHEKLLRDALQALFVGRAGILREVGNPLEEVIGQPFAFSGREGGEIFRHTVLFGSGIQDAKIRNYRSNNLSIVISLSISSRKYLFCNAG
jgi:hypothetical protein